ncbi:MAG: YihY family inner membrane protein [Bacteroidales bacterium]|nr:YihY family inner membrane protein [Bacteroidales bacterium]
MLNRFRHLFEKDIWTISAKDKNPVLSFFVRQGRIFLIALRGFTEDKIQLRASALSFYTMLSIVPILAMVFGISQGFGFKEFLINSINQRFDKQQELIDVLLGFVENYLGRFSGGFITAIGLIILFWSVMKVLGNIESSFNNIWQIKKSRMFTRKFTDYLSILVIAPVLLLVTLSLNVSQIPGISEDIAFLHYLDSFLKILVRFFSFTLIWFVFTLLYILIPNTKVKFLPAMIAGIIAGTMFQLLQWGYVNFQSLLTGYSAIYGTFAAIPLFMMWLELSWLIVLLGAEISFAYQNAEHYEQEAEGVDVSHKQRKVLTLLVTKTIVKNFTEGKLPLKAAEIANLHGIPVRLVRDIIYDLNRCGIINETLTGDVREIAYQPAVDPSKISVSFVIDSLDKHGHQASLDKYSKELSELSALVESFYKDLQKSSGNILVRDL